MHSRFVSDYYFQCLTMFASILTWCLLPVLVWSDNWHLTTFGHDNHIIHISSLNMWFALCGSAVGAFCGCIFIFKKVDAHTLIFSMFTVIFYLHTGRDCIYFIIWCLSKSRASNRDWRDNWINLFFTGS